MVHLELWHSLQATCKAAGVTLIAVSKKKPVAEIQALYDAGQRDFGENYVQELVEKAPLLPADIRWHFIGHLQSNKVKYIAPFVHCIHTVDSFSLLQTIQKQGEKAGRVLDVLLQLHVAAEEEKFGLDEKEILEFLEYYEAQKESLQQVRICGIMAMASFTRNTEQIESEFHRAKILFDNLAQTTFFQRPYFNTLSMGMSGDYGEAIAAGSTAVRIGSLLFGER